MKAASTVLTPVVIFWSLLLGACETPTIRANPDAKVPPDQMAILIVDVRSVIGVQPVLDSLDGQTMHHGLQLVNMKVEMSPGPHRASVRFFEQKIIGSMSCSAENQNVDFLAEPKHTYQVQAIVTGEYPCFLGGTRNWKAVIVDITATAQPA